MNNTDPSVSDKIRMSIPFFRKRSTYLNDYELCILFFCVYAIINDITKQAKAYLKWIDDNLWDLNRMQKQPEEIMVEPGEQCIKPYECLVFPECHGSRKLHESEKRRA